MFLFPLKNKAHKGARSSGSWKHPKIKNNVVISIRGHAPAWYFSLWVSPQVPFPCSLSSPLYTTLPFAPLYQCKYQDFPSRNLCPEPHVQAPQLNTEKDTLCWPLGHGLCFLQALWGMGPHILSIILFIILNLIWNYQYELNDIPSLKTWISSLCSTK